VSRYAWPLALLAQAGLLALALWAAPHLAPGPVRSAMGAFVGAVLLSLGSVAVLVRWLPSRPARLVAAGVGAAALLFVGLTHGATLAHGLLVDLALVALAAALGSLVGERVEAAGHLLPACVVAGCADVASVIHPDGPTHRITESERALSLAAYSFPPPGFRELAPGLGAGDLIFVALVLAVAGRHGLPFRRTAVLSVIGALAAGALSAAFEAPFPALPLIGLAVVAGLPAARQIPRKDRTVAQFSMVLAVVALASLWVRLRYL
jgi:hypothetical protein